MAKLKFDRLINVGLKSSSTTTIPKDELWKVTIFSHKSNVELNGDYIDTSRSAIFLANGVKLKTSGNIDIQGIAFKTV